MEKIPTFQPPEQEKEPMTVNVLEAVSEQEVQDIIDIDRKIFPTMPVAEEEIRETLESKGIQILLKDAESRTVGYIISLPHDEAYEFLSEIDTDLVKETGGLYIESIGILPELRKTRRYLEKEK